MRHFTVKFTPEGGWFHPFDRVVAAEDDVQRVAIHEMRLLEGNRAIMLYEFGGDLDRAHEIVDEQLGAMGYQTSELDNTLLVIATFETNPTTQALLEIPDQFEFVIDTPMLFDDRGNLYVTLVGEESAIRAALDAVPDEVVVSVERTGPYKPDAERLFSLLTPRQQETVRTAVEAGYYEVPREATYDDVAALLDRTGPTVGEHLRKIEARLVKAVVPTEE